MTVVAVATFSAHFVYVCIASGDAGVSAYVCVAVCDAGFASSAQP